MNMYRNIDRSKIQFDFIVHKEGIFDNEIKNMGGNVFKLDYINKIGPYSYKKQLEKFFKEHSEYKIIHSHLNQVTGIVLEVAKKCKIPIRIAHSHNTKASGNFITKIYKAHLGKKIKENATINLACGEAAGKWLYKTEPFIIIKNGINLEKFKFNNLYREEIRTELKIDDDKVIIGHVGRFEAQKNHKFIIDIFNNIVKKNKNYILVLIGTGKLKEEIMVKVKTYGIEENVKFLDVRDDVYKIYSAMDFFLFPSLHEGFPLTLIEAQASGLKIICSDRISENTNITKKIKYISLNKNAEYWANYILNLECTRNADISELYAQEYGDKENAKLLEDVYLSNFNKL